MNTANWIPDLFMRTRHGKGSVDAVLAIRRTRSARPVRPGFESAYAAYEAKTESGELKLFKRLPAVDLWRKMLSMLFETGHPWITFRTLQHPLPQQHVGVVHSSNLCTEITLNTSDSETAVCNLGSVNLAQHLTGWRDRSTTSSAAPCHGHAHAGQRHRHQLLRR